MKSDNKPISFDMEPCKPDRTDSHDETETIRELLIGIAAFGLIVWGVVLGFVERKLYFTLGLWLGVLMALLAACHMWWSINRAVDLGDGASKYVLSQNMVRYGVMVVIFGIICILDFANPLAAFAGLMCLKAGAYLQPFTHKIINKLKRR